MAAAQGEEDAGGYDEVAQLDDVRRRFAEFLWNYSEYCATSTTASDQGAALPSGSNAATVWPYQLRPRALARSRACAAARPRPLHDLCGTYEK